MARILEVCGNVTLIWVRFTVPLNSVKRLLNARRCLKLWASVLQNAVASNENFHQDKKAWPHPPHFRFVGGLQKAAKCECTSASQHVVCDI